MDKRELAADLAKEAARLALALLAVGTWLGCALMFLVLRGLA